MKYKIRLYPVFFITTIFFLVNTFSAQVCFTPAVNFAAISSPVSIISADFNNDGKADLAATTAGNNKVAVLLGNGVGSFSAAVYYSVPTQPRSIVSADFNGDGFADLATANPNSGNVSVLLGTGTGTFGVATNFVVNASAITSADFNGDFKMDIAVTGGTSGVAVLFGNGTGAFGPPNNFAAGTGASSIISVDFNGDLKTDIAVANTGSNDVSILLGNGAGNFAPATSFGIGVQPSSLISADFNGDGLVDLAAGLNSNKVSILLSIGSGSFGGATTFTVSSPISVTSADFNSDGKADLAAVKYAIAGAVSVFLGDGLGSLGASISFAAGNGTYYICNGDFNGDAKPDLAAVNVTSNDISVLLNSPLPSVTVSASATSVCPGTSVTLTASGTTTYSWSANAGSAITNTVTVNPLANTTYNVVGSNLGCPVTDTAFITIGMSTPPTPDICMVTVDSLSKNNNIIWNKTLYPSADTFFVYRDTANNAYGLIGKVPYTSLSIFTDTVRTLYAANGDPTASSWRYKIAIKDTCSGTVGIKSPYHQTIFMQNTSANFNWSEYKIEGQPLPVPTLSNYLFKRDTLANGNYVTIQTLSASSIAYVDPQYSNYQATADWRVETLWSTVCTPSMRLGNKNNQGAIVKSRSNVRNNRGIGVNQVTTNNNQVRIYPNPANNELTIVLSKNCNNFQMEITNVLGEVVKNISITNAKSKINISEIENGVYFVKISSIGNSFIQKLIVQR